MTMPTMMNCSHQGEGWCLNCVQHLVREHKGRAMLDLITYTQKLTEACDRYEKSAPTVAEHCNDLFIRIRERPDRVTLAELDSVQRLWDGDWMGPIYAANAIYKLRHRLGMDVTGQAEF